MKHSKLFLTGMAALLLSFGLMMTGCDSGGDSDGGDPINAAEYIDIAVETAGADAVGGDPAVAAVYTVTVKQPIPTTNKAVFTNVADAAVEYIPALGDETTAALQAEAIKTALNDAAGAKYTAAVGTGANTHVITLTALADGAIANAPAVTIETYEAPPAKTAAIAAALTAGDNAVKITGVTVAGAFKDDAAVKAYIKNDGTELLISTDASAPDGYAAAAGAVFIADRGANNVPVLWVKGLPAAATPVTAGASLLSGGSAGAVSVKITGGAQTGDVGAVTAASGVATVIPAGTYVIDDDAGSAGEITLVGTDKITYNKNGTAVSNAPVPAANGFNDQLRAVLAATGLLAATDKITVGAKGIITGVEIAAASPTTAKINAVLGVHDNVTLGVTNTETDGALTIPAGKTLTVGADGTLNIGANCAVTINGTLVVGSGGNTVTIDLATVTATAAEPKFADGATGVVTLSDTNTITFATTGTIVVAGTGKVELANTTLGAGTYTSTGATVITSLAAGDEIVTDTTADDGLAIGTGSNTITLYAVGSAAATFTLTDTTDSTAGKITLGAAGITLPAATGSGATGAILGVSGTSNVGGIAIAGTSGLTLGGGGGTNQPATIAFASTGGLLKGFTHGSNVGTPIKIVAGTVEVPLVFGTNAAFAFTYSNDTCTATTDSVTLKGPTTGTATIDVNSVPAAT